MLLQVKYLLPVVALVAFQLVLNSWPASAQTDGEKDDLDSAELFLRPVVIKYGHSHPGIYTWQGGSGVGQGWGQYKPKAQQNQGWGGWGKDKKKKKKKGKKKKKDKKKKKEKKKKGGWGEEKKKKEKKKKEKKKGGWGWSWGWVEDGQGQAGAGGYGGGGGGGGEDSKEWKGGDDDDKGRFGPAIQPLTQSIVARFGGPSDYHPAEESYEYDGYNNEGFYQDAYHF